MLKSITVLAIFGLVLANSAFADSSVIGRADFLIQSDAHGPIDSQIRETADGKIVGQGAGLPGTNTLVSLERQAGGVKGQVYGRFLNITCNGSTCVDNGSTNLNVTVSTVGGVTHIDGSMAFNFIHVAYTADQISISTNDATFALNRQADGNFTGNGAYSHISLDPSFSATLSSSGSLAAVSQDPALVLAVLVSPFCGDRI